MANPSRVLIVEDVASLALAYQGYLSSEPLAVETAETGAEASERIAKWRPDVVVLDVNLPDISGIELMKRLRTDGLACDVIIITNQGSVSLAVEAMREGAVDFVMKPFSAERLRTTVRNALERRKLETRVETLKQELGRDHFAGFIGGSLAMQSVYEILRNAAPSRASVFVTGESGTGKELCADALHRLSPRKSKQLVAINCASIPKDLLESEVFGHVKGAFTGASADRLGAVLQADGGTLFLDELCEMDLSLQAKLLRFLQTGSVQRVGEDKPRPVDVRVVCATNRDPVAEVAAGRFREDLYYRLHVIPVELPPLRDREDDVLLIARRFLAQYAKEEGKAFRSFDPDVETAMLAHSWPGNVRELQNLIRKVCVLNSGEVVTLSMLPKDLQGKANRTAGAGKEQHLQRSDEAIVPLETVIQRTIQAAIDKCGGNIPRAAQALGLSPSTLYRRLQALS